jgi:SAM-dependent methyltransferase
LLFEHRRLAQIYDALEGDRPDLDLYERLVGEFGARTVLDVGCGTGTLADRLAGRGVEVIAVDPAAASLDVARSKSHARRVRWLLGDATTLPPLQVDLATMTGNVAQVFIRDEEWDSTLRCIGRCLRPGGRIAFETRDPAKKAWLGWNRDQTYRRIEITGVGPVQTWTEVLDVEGDLVSFRTTFVFERDGARLSSDSTLRFRGRVEVADSLARARLMLEDVRDAADRPGLEFVFIARRSTETLGAPPPPSRLLKRSRL